MLIMKHDVGRACQNAPRLRTLYLRKIQLWAEEDANPSNKIYGKDNEYRFR